MNGVIAIDMGATNIRVGILDASLHILEVVRERTSHEGSEALIQQIIRLIKSLPYEKYEIQSIAIGVPGRVRNDGYIFELPNIHVKDLDLCTPLGAEFHVPVYVLNDAVAAGLAEAVSGSGKHEKNVYFVTISSGVGGSFFRNRQYTVSSTEIGHTLFSYHGEYYEFEKIASGYGILELAKLNGITLEQGYQLFEGYRNGDAALSALYRDWLALFQRFFQFIQRSFDPNIIVLTGGVMKSASIFFEDFKAMNPNCHFAMAYHDQDAGLIGAGCHGLMQKGKLDLAE